MDHTIISRPVPSSPISRSYADTAFTISYFDNSVYPFRLLIFSVGNFFSGICVVEFFSTAKIPLSVCVGGGIFKKGWGNF